MRVSVIIPIYRVQDHLRQCVDSVIAQDYGDLEIILVDDGSPDRCPAICDAYAVKDSRVKVIHKENGGLSDARNVGLCSASGDYVLFLDGDDYWRHSDAVSRLVETASEGQRPDLVLFDYVRSDRRADGFKGHNKPFACERVRGRSKIDALEYLLETARYAPSAATQLIRRELLVENQIFFERDILSEDIDWAFKVWLYVERASAINHPFYVYRWRTGSISDSFNDKHARDLFNTIKKWIDYSNNTIGDPRLRRLYLGYCAYQFAILMGLVSNLGGAARRVLLKELKPYRAVLENDINYKTRIVKRLHALLGFQASCALLGAFTRHKKARQATALSFRPFRPASPQLKNLLIVSDAPWADDNSFGSSFSNLFGGEHGFRIANIYAQPGLPDTTVCHRFFQITEKGILRSIFSRNSPSGLEIAPGADSASNAVRLGPREAALLATLKTLRWQVFFWLRDVVWATGRWKSGELNAFIDDVKPDLIFLPVYYSSYLNNIGVYAWQRAGVRMVGYISDDNYSLRQFSLSPLFWIDRLIKRRYVKKAIDRCELLYVITHPQKVEYEASLQVPCKVLFKGGDFSRLDQAKTVVNSPLKLVYTGNVGGGRWKTLARIARELKEINGEGRRAILHIYTLSPMTRRMVQSLQIEGSSELKGGIPADQVRRVQRDGDVLVHVEPFELGERYKARLSFSTKIVDYFESGRCILAVGWRETGAIKYLVQEDAGIVVTDPEAIGEALKDLLAHPEKVLAYSGKAFDCGQRNHQVGDIRRNLYGELEVLACE